MDTRFNLTGLKKIYNDSLERKEHTLVFQIKQGKGLFNFLMFFSDDDVESKDKLFLFLRQTNTLLELKLYGSHRNGDFTAYIKEKQKELIIKELGLTIHDGTFDFIKFLENLNAAIPNDLPKKNLIVNLKNAWPYIKDIIPNIIDDSDKTILQGIKHLSSDQKPREKTLRKLYIFVDGDISTITALIDNLKSKNMTLAWTNDEKKKELGITEIFTKLTGD